MSPVSMAKFLSLGGWARRSARAGSHPRPNQDEKQRAEFLALFLHERQCQTAELTKDLLLIKAEGFDFFTLREWDDICHG
jgi:hypothetical protein